MSARPSGGFMVRNAAPSTRVVMGKLLKFRRCAAGQLEMRNAERTGFPGKKRRGRDSNPRDVHHVKTISSRFPSATRTPLRVARWRSSELGSVAEGSARGQFASALSSKLRRCAKGDPSL